MSTKQIWATALQLSPKQRARLAADLLASLDEKTERDAAKAWEKEVGRRLADLDTGRAKTITWAQARRIIHGR